MNGIGSVIRNLRERMGVSQDKLASWVGVSRATIAQIELGNRQPESMELFRMADFFGCTVSDLARGDEEGLSAVGVRFRRSMGAGEDDSVWRVVSSSISLAREAANLRSLLGMGVVDTPIMEYRLSAPSDKGEAVFQGNQVAYRERMRLNLGSDPIQDVRELMEAQGVLVGETALPTDVSGFMVNLGDSGFLCMVKESDSALRKRFSLAHEYGHVLMDACLKSVVSRTSEIDELSEVRANVFAAAFLMPEQGCREMIRGAGKGCPSRERTDVFDEATVIRVEERGRQEEQQVQLYDAARLAERFGASLQAVLFRLRNLGIINQSRLDQLLLEDSTPLGCNLRKLMRSVEDRGKLSTPGLFRNNVISMALEALRRGLISHGKCIETATLACRPDEMASFREVMDQIRPDLVPVAIPV
jgi:Zn-dependent peptidase ImmA (M78 family)/transcriptional regulator with XRE-family HTH domain